MSENTSKNRAGWNATSDAYQARHASQLDRKPLAWGIWGLPESELEVLGDLQGRRVLELGCGAAQWSLFLRREGVDVVGMDLSERQLHHARTRCGEWKVPDLPLIHGDAERLPFGPASFDVVFCDHGATTFADPRRTVPEAARVLRSGGLFAFNIQSPLNSLLFDAVEDVTTDTVQCNYFELEKCEDEEHVTFQLPFGEWIRLFRSSGFEVLDLIELRPPVDAATTYDGWDDLEQARTWPAENIWKLRRR